MDQNSHIPPASGSHDDEVAELRRRLAEASRMASIGRLLAGIIHELNTPIGSLFCNSELMVRCLDRLAPALADIPPGPAAATAAETVETMRSLAAVDGMACERIRSVIRNLKTLARAEEGVPRVVDVRGLLQTALKLAGYEFRDRVTVEAQLGELPEVECYPELLTQVFLNLLVNAAQAIDGAGAIKVRTAAESGHVTVSISDSGRGIPPEHQGKVFLPGFTTKPAGIGTGLGLSLSREIVVERHGGTLQFESEPGAGTTFHVRLPIRLAAKSRSASGVDAGR